MLNTTEVSATPSPPIKFLLTIDEAAQALSLGRTYFYRLVMCNEIASMKVGRVRRIPVSALADYVARHLNEKL